LEVNKTMTEKTQNFQKSEELCPTHSAIEELKSHQTNGGMEQLGSTQFEKFSANPDVLDFLAFFQKISVEEQRLLEIKQQMLEKQRDLQNRLVKEIERKKIMIANLTSEISDFQNRIQQLGQALGGNIYDKPQPPKINSPIPYNTELLKTLPECIGLLRCIKPENCRNYESCLNNYMTAEIRNEVLKF
jgi:hypothetical protein